MSTDTSPASRPEPLEPASPLPYVAYAFLVICVAVTTFTLVTPEARSWLSGVAPRQHAWQPFTAAFVHGWPGFPAVPHLVLNAVLIARVGALAERALGHARFLLLSLASLTASAAAVHLTGGANGASFVIWSWGPALFLRMRASRDPARGREIRGWLVVMYGVVTLAMTALPYAFGWRGHPLVAFYRANTFHIVATVVGVLFAFVWRRTLSRPR